MTTYRVTLWRGAFNVTAASAHLARLEAVEALAESPDLIVVEPLEDDETDTDDE